ncbi:hypothetical protein AYK20_04560 [Thermoplasmatales archaeon SG8-52-1]|nr:MAG: hypothetical protein AYK20_04560 [Thermoplasmatales archaeon SG8-52-1]
MKHKLEIVLGIGIAVMVLVSLGFYILNAGNIELTEFFSIFIAIILVVSAMYILWDRIKNMREGFPAHDERLKLTNYKACSYGFIASIWSAVGAPLLSLIFFDYELPGNYVTAIVVLCGGLAFIISFLYLARKGN